MPTCWRKSLSVSQLNCAFLFELQQLPTAASARSAGQAMVITVDWTRTWMDGRIKIWAVQTFVADPTIV